MRLATKLVHAGELDPRPHGAVSMPIFQSSTFAMAPPGAPGSGAGDYHDVRYIRLSNTPNHVVLGAKLASLEGAEAALVTASGMAAISAVFMATCSAGDHVIAHDGVYGGTHAFLARDLPRFGVETTFVDATDAAGLEAALRPRTRVVYVEGLTNPLLRVCDLEGVAAFARRHGLVSVIDNTLVTPVHCRPVEHGFDVVVHSATKYLNGHSDIVAGVVAGRRAHVESAKQTLDHLGGALDPHACFLLQRGLKTLALRVGRQSESALAFARFLARHAAVSAVYYPFLEEHPHYERARALFSAGGGLLSFELRGGLAAAARLLERLELAIVAPSLGGPETLVTLPATTSHAGLSAAERARQGVRDDLVRVSIGLEAVEDLIADFEHALGG